MDGKEPPARRFDPIGAFTRWQNSLIAKPSFQSWAARFPLTRRVARKDGEKLFDLVAGFVYSQTLWACVELDILDKLKAGPKSAAALALVCDVPAKRMEILCNSATSVGLLRRGRDGRFEVARLGAALIGVPGLMDMVRHHDILYRDLSDPIAVLRDEAKTELAEFWPYVLGQTADAPETATVARYSDLMAKSQALVAEETLRTVSFRGVTTLMDVGGGTGAFLREVQKAAPDVSLVVFDLPDVVADVSDLQAIGGSFLEPLPRVADAISLVRVLYDHNDRTIEKLLAHVYEALPEGGRLIVSEPMSGGDTPLRPTDSYFAFYTMAMRTGQVRSQAEIAGHLRKAGFLDVQTPRPDRAYVTSVVTARKS